MVKIYPNKIRLFLFSLISYSLAFLLIYLVFKQGASSIFALVVFILAILFLILIASVFLVRLLSKKPLISANSKGIRVCRYGFKQQLILWSEIAQIEVVRELDETVTRRRGRTFSKWKVTEEIRFFLKQEDFKKSCIGIESRLMSIPLEEILEKLRGIAEADELVAAAAQDWEQKKKDRSAFGTARMRNLWNLSYPAVFILMIVGVAVQDQCSRRTDAFDLVPTSVELACKTLPDARIDCFMKEYEKENGKLKRDIWFKGVIEIKDFLDQSSKYRTFYLQTSRALIPIATVDYTKVVVGGGGQDIEPYKSLNKIKAFIEERPTESSVEVKYDQPDF